MSWLGNFLGTLLDPLVFGGILIVLLLIGDAIRRYRRRSA
jgi:hypothetical protein